MSVSVRRRLLAPLVLGALACVLPTAAAQATVPGAVACDDSPLAQPFLSYGDARSYELAPGGDFEGSLDGWSLGGSAGAVPGSADADGSSSLGLSAGSSAQSPDICVNAAYPSFRFFARSDRPGSAIVVSVVYQTTFGQTALPVGAVVPGRNWAPSPSMPTLSAVFAGRTAPVELRFTQLTGSAQVDNVFIDPHTVH